MSMSVCASCQKARESAMNAMRAGVRGDWRTAQQAAATAAKHVGEKIASEAERVRERLKK